MQEVQYKSFSLKTHKKNWKAGSPNVCQFELTFKCGLRCMHCYSDCYNKPYMIRDELSTTQVKELIDKVFELGVLWFCFTGGDPLERGDFLELYAYAKNKGFIATVFTTGFSMTEKIASYLKKNPPFAIEITINGVTKETYEAVTQVKGSFEKTMRGLELMLRHNLPIKVKTMATKQNIKELSQIKTFLKEKSLKFYPTSLLHARLNGDLAPCSLRLSREEIHALDKDFKVQSLKDENDILDKRKIDAKPERENKKIFNCAFGGGDGINIDPYGRVFPCSCIRKPEMDFLKSGIAEIKQWLSDISATMISMEFAADSKCRACPVFDECPRCPGRALLEGGRLDAPIEYFCEFSERRCTDGKAEI